jgi:hypothetical protein
VVPLLEVKVAEAGLPNNTGTFEGVTRTLTGTLKVPLVVVMLTVAV